MRKDYIPDTSIGDSEAGFIERFWTDNWKNSGGVESRLNRYISSFDRFALKSEWRLMRKFITPATHNRLLDGGCGTGEWCRYLNDQGYTTVGIDISRETIEKLQSLFPNDAFLAGDIRHLDVPDDSFDGYYSWGTFEHFAAGLQPCISEAFRVLKPGGYLFITVPFDSLGLALAHPFMTAPKKAEKGTKRFYQWRLSRQELATELTQGGFDVIKLRPIHRRQTIVRMLHHGFGVDYDGRFARFTGLLLGSILPRGLVGHMLMAVAKKPVSEDA